MGKIIQYLDLKSTYPNVWMKDGEKYTFDFFLDYGKDKSHNWESDWKIVKFADKLKDCLCIILGCTKEQWENDREFRDKELGPEWTKWPVEVCYEVVDYESDTYYFTSETEATECVKKFEGKCFDVIKLDPIVLTPRKFIQLLGTDCGRNIIHPNTWVNATMADYYEVKGLESVPKERLHLYEGPKWIITDVRFPNEAQAIKSRGGIIIKVNRDGLVQTDNHESENSMKDYKFDYTIENNSTIENLINEVEVFLHSQNLIK